jgi:hypothetical protein
MAPGRIWPVEGFSETVTVVPDAREHAMVRARPAWLVFILCSAATSVSAQQPLVISPVPLPERPVRTTPPAVPEPAAAPRMAAPRTNAGAPGTGKREPLQPIRAGGDLAESHPRNPSKATKPYPGLFSWDDHQ